MTDKPDTPHPSSVPQDNRGIQPGLMLGGVFAAAIGFGALIWRARSGMKGSDRTPTSP